MKKNLHLSKLKNKQAVLVGVFPCDQESIIIQPSKYFDLRYLVARKTPEELWARQFLPQEKICLYSLSTKKPSLEKNDFGSILKHSDVTKVIKENKIKYLWLTVANKDRKQIYGVAKNHDFEVIGPNLVWQNNLENKIWFDQFLAENNLPKPSSQIINPTKSKVKISGRLVLQEAISDGGEGTFFINSKDDLQKILNRKNKNNPDYLLREFIPGKPCGITILCTPDIIALSPIREQCFSNKDGQDHIFAGIQWLPNSSIGRNKEPINKIFLRLGSILQEKGFLGFANVDFILSEGGTIKIIECNPRFSSSTTQIAINPNLISNIQAGNLIIERYIKKSLITPKKVLPIPQSEYSGSVLNLDIENGKRFKVKQTYPIGVYSFKNKDVKFVSPDIRQAQKDDQFIYFSTVDLNEIFRKNRAAGIITANFPLFDSSGNINSAGRMLSDYFDYDLKKS